MRNVAEAENFAKFYLKVVYGDAGNIVYDELRLRHHVEEHFLGYADSQESVEKKEKRFRNWWSDFKARKVGSLQPETKSEPGSRYEVVMKILEMTVGLKPELWQWSLQIRSDGMTQLLSKELVVPAPTMRD